MFSSNSSRSYPPIAYRRDWGADASQPIRKLGVALDAITPSNDDCTIRIIYSEHGQYAVSIARYANFCFAGPVLESHRIGLTHEVVEELRTKKFILPCSLFSGHPVKTLWVVSDEGEHAWSQMINN